MIHINATILGERPSGLGQYALNVIRALDGLRAGLVVHTSSPELLAGLRAVVRRATPLVRPERGMLGHGARLFWCQAVLRTRVLRAQATVLLNTLPEGVLGSRVPQVTVVHDLLPLLFPEEYPRQQYYFRHLVRALLRESRAVIADSEATRRHALDAYGLPPDRVHVVPCGYDAARFRPAGPAADDGGVPYVLCVGNLLPHKNLPRLIEAVARAARHTPVRLVVAGSGRPGEVAALEAAAARTGARVKLRRYVPADDLPGLYRGARALALPSLAEGFGLPALEALLGRALRLTLVFTVPVAGLAIALAEPAIRVLLERGAFTAESTTLTATALACYAPGLIGMAGAQVLVRAYQALHEVGRMVWTGVVVIALNMALMPALTVLVGFRGLPIAISTSSLALFVVMLLAIRPRLPGLGLQAILGAAARILVAAMVAGVFVWLARGVGGGGALAELVVGAMVGTSAYALLLFWLSREDAQSALAFVAPSLARRI